MRNVLPRWIYSIKKRYIIHFTSRVVVVVDKDNQFAFTMASAADYSVSSSIEPFLTLFTSPDAVAAAGPADAELVELMSGLSGDLSHLPATSATAMARITYLNRMLTRVREAAQARPLASLAFA